MLELNSAIYIRQHRRYILAQVSIGTKVLLVTTTSLMLVMISTFILLMTEIFEPNKTSSFNSNSLLVKER